MWALGYLLKLCSLSRTQRAIVLLHPRDFSKGVLVSSLHNFLDCEPLVNRESFILLYKLPWNYFLLKKSMNSTNN